MRCCYVSLVFNNASLVNETANREKINICTFTLHSLSLKMIFSTQDAGYSSRLGPRGHFLSIVSVGGERWVSVGGSRATPGPLLVCSGSRSL